MIIVRRLAPVRHLLASDSLMNDRPSEGASSRLRLFASADAWIEGTAESQLKFASTLEGVTAVAGMPDLHPGPHGPVGCAAVFSNTAVIGYSGSTSFNGSTCKSQQNRCNPGKAESDCGCFTQ